MSPEILDLRLEIGHLPEMETARLPPQKPLLMIPARLASLRLPRKPLADIHGEPMIVHVWRRAVESNIGPVVVACDGAEIADVIEKVGGRAVVTKPDHPTGSDRIWDALHSLDGHGAYDAIINVQGDLPTVDPAAICAAFRLLADPIVDVATLAAAIEKEEDKHAPHIVKVVIDAPSGARQGRAIYFSRLPVPSGEGAMYHHIGLYAYRREALAAFVAAKQAPLEMRESLEQLRALSLNLRIEAAVVQDVPLGVDTPADLEMARTMLRSR